MTFHTFPIACLRNPVNPPRSVFSITFLLPQDDTPDVIPRHTMLRHTYHLSAARNFRLNPDPTSGLSSLDPPTFICIPAQVCPVSRHPALARRARVRRRSTHVRQPSACRLLVPRPTIPYSHVSRETCEDNHPISPRERERERIRHAPGLPAPSSRPPSCSLRSPSCAAGADHGDCRAAIRRPPSLLLIGFT